MPITEREALEWHDRGQQAKAEGRQREAIAAFQLAASYFEETEGTESPDLTNVLADWADSLLELCRYEAAEQTARRAKDIIARLRDRLHSQTRAALVPRIFGLHGRSLRELGRYEDAELDLKEAIREAEASVGPEHPVVAALWNEYGILCKYWGKFEDGERSYRRALATLEKEYGEESLETASVYHNLGGLEHARGNFARGEPLGHLAYQIRRRFMGENTPETVADAVAWGGLLDGLGRHEESVPIYRRALSYYEKRFGPEHFEVAATLHNLGAARAAQGCLTEARGLLKRCVEIKRILFRKDHPEVRLSETLLECIGGLSGGGVRAGTHGSPLSKCRASAQATACARQTREQL